MSQNCATIMNGHEKEPLLSGVASSSRSKDCTKSVTLDLNCGLDPREKLVEFSVGAQEEKIKCRRLTLQSTSPVFGSILTDADNNGKNHEIIELPDVQPQHFRNFVKYVEEDQHFTSASFTVQEVDEVFKIAKKYSVSVLQDKCRQFLQRSRSIDNAITIYQSAQMLDEPQLEYDTYSFIVDVHIDISSEWGKWEQFFESQNESLNNFSKILESKDFVNLVHHNLCTFLKLDEIVVSELNFFRAVCRWAKAECGRNDLEDSPLNIRLVLQSAVHLIRFPLMSLPDFRLYVVPKKILSTEEVDCLTQYLGLTDRERQRADVTKIFPFKYKRRGIPTPKTYTVQFYDCLIYNSDMWQGKWKCNLIKVNCPIEIVSFGFDGPILADAVYDVKIKLVIDDQENCENEENDESMASKYDIVHAKKERTFFVKFDQPYKLKPNVFYRACYALTGPKTIWGVQPKNEVKMRCGDAKNNCNVVFTYKFVDGQVPEIRFTIPSS